MKTEAEIRDELKFQKSEYDKLKNRLEITKEMSYPSRSEIHAVMSRHAARIQIIEWILSND